MLEASQNNSTTLIMISRKVCRVISGAGGREAGSVAQKELVKIVVPFVMLRVEHKALPQLAVLSLSHMLAPHLPF